MKCRLIHSGWKRLSIRVSAGVTALRLHDRLLGSDAHELDVRNAAQAAQDPLETLLIEAQRIAAGNEDIAGRRASRRCTRSLLEIVLLMLRLAGGADEPGARVQ